MSAPLPASLQGAPQLGRWISLEQQGFIGFRTGKVELGQGIQTALAQIVAHELGADLTRLLPLGVDTDSAPNEGITAGSLSIEVSGRSLRLAAAQAHWALIDAAAKRLGLPAGELVLDDGAILHKGAATGLTIWLVAPDVDWSQTITGQAALRQGATMIGSSPARPDLAAKYRGKGFIHDLALPGMIHARVIRQPVRLARLDAVDTGWLERRYPTVSLHRQGDFLAVLSASEADAAAAQAEVERFVHWAEAPERRPEPPVQSETIGSDLPETGDAVDYEQTFSRRNIAHASIGPSCALGHVKDGHLTVWTHSQGIFELREAIARALSMSEADITLIHAHGSGCYGHNAADDVGMDAAILAVARPDTPVRVQWSRPDEMSKGPLGAAMSHRVRATLRDGRITALRSEVTSQSHVQRPGNCGFVNLTSAEALDPGHVPSRVEDLALMRGGGASRNALSLYDIPQQATVHVDARSQIRTSALRSLGAHLNVFALESAIDDLARMAGADPLTFRLAHLADARARAVLSKAGEMADWGGRRLGEGEALGLGVARYKNKGAWLAAVAQVRVEEEVRLSHLWLCCDAGVLINREGARSQIEGGAIQAASWTLKEAVPTENDRVAPFDWEAYPILTFSEVPRIETAFIIDPEAPSLGAGEASQGPVAAAIGNAVARALGARIAHLPLTRDRVMEALLAE